MDPQIDWRRPDGVPHDLVALWEDPTWRDLDSATVLMLRQQVLQRLEDGGAPSSSGPSFGSVVLDAAAFGLGVAAAMVAVGVGRAASQRPRVAPAPSRGRTRGGRG